MKAVRTTTINGWPTNHDVLSIPGWIAGSSDYDLETAQRQVYHSISTWQLEYGMGGEITVECTDADSGRYAFVRTTKDGRRVAFEWRDGYENMSAEEEDFAESVVFCTHDFDAFFRLPPHAFVQYLEGEMK
jgi:hypothetical protein